MYFTSKRDGSSDIFRKRLTPTPRLKKPLYVQGRILNSETGLPVHCELFWGQVSGSNFLEYFNTYTGAFEVMLTEYDAYKFQPRKANHTSDPIRVDPRKLELQGIDTLQLTLYVTPKDLKEKETVSVMPTNHIQGSESKDSPIGVNVIAFYDINFVKGKAIILAKSRNGLKYLLDLMNSHPATEILITGHTDNVGDEKALIELSMKRAVAIQDYLVHRGIRKERIQVDGMGASRPLFENTTEKGREQNRRVEVSMINHSE
jgi:outer membrane protein OmpA-like peptidoglycan-associated protein